LPIHISSFYSLLHLFNTFLQNGKTFFTSEHYYIDKFSEVTKKMRHRKEDKKMKNRKKYIIIGAVILFIGILAGLGVTVACGPNGNWHKGFHSRFHCGDVTDFVLWKMDKHVKDLNLNEEQKQEYDRVRGQIKTSITEAMEKRKEFHGIVEAELSKENPDLKSLADLIKKRLVKMPGLIGEPLDLFVEFYNILDENQKAKVIERLRWRMG